MYELTIYKQRNKTRYFHSYRRRHALMLVYHSWTLTEMTRRPIYKKILRFS